MRDCKPTVYHFHGLLNVLNIEGRSILEIDGVDQAEEVCVVNNETFDKALVGLHSLTDLPDYLLHSFIFRLHSNHYPVIQYIKHLVGVDRDLLKQE